MGVCSRQFPKHLSSGAGCSDSLLGPWLAPWHRFLPHGHRHSSRIQICPAAFSPDRTLVQSHHRPEPGHLPCPSPASVSPGVQGRAGWGRLPRKTRGEWKRSVRGPYLAAAGTAIPPGLPVPLIAAEHNLRNGPAGPGAPRVPAPAPPCRAALDTVGPGGGGSGASREGIRCAGSHARTLGYGPEGWGRLAGAGSP